MCDYAEQRSWALNILLRHDKRVSEFILHGIADLVRRRVLDRRFDGAVLNSARAKSKGLWRRAEVRGVLVRAGLRTFVEQTHARSERRGLPLSSEKIFPLFFQVWAAVKVTYLFLMYIYGKKYIDVRRLRSSQFSRFLLLKHKLISLGFDVAYRYVLQCLVYRARSWSLIVGLHQTIGLFTDICMSFQRPAFVARRNLPSLRILRAWASLRVHQTMFRSNITPIKWNENESHRGEKRS